MDDLIAIIVPYVKGGTDEGKIRHVLENLGVSTRSDLLHLKEGDMDEIVAVVSFRKMKQHLTQTTTVVSRASTGYNLDLEKIVAPADFRLMKSGEILEEEERKSVLQRIGDDIGKSSLKCVSSTVQEVARNLVTEYSKCFGAVMHDDLETTALTGNIAQFIRRRANYYRDKKKGGRTCDENRRRSKTFNVHAASGLQQERDMPDLPTQTELDALETRRLSLVDMFAGNEPYNLAKIRQEMKMTYVLQRHDINNEMDIELFLERWPYCGDELVLQDHFCHLMAINRERVAERQTAVLPKWANYCTTLAGKRRSGAMKLVPERIRKILRKASSQNFPGHDLLAVILSLCHHFNVPDGRLFLFFDEGTSKGVVEASPEILDGKPVLAVLGKNPFSNPDCYLVYGKRVINTRKISIGNAVHSLLQSFYVFKREYPEKPAPILEFMQWDLYRIEGEVSRVERTRTPNGVWRKDPPKLSPRYSTMKTAFTLCQSLFPTRGEDNDDDDVEEEL